MSYVLDTSIIIDLQKKKMSTIEKLKILSMLNPNPAKITFITEFEFLFGIKERSHKNIRRSIEFIRDFQILQSTPETAAVLAELKYKYGSKGINFSLSDLLIASIIISHNMTLVTRDKDFENIQELKKIIIE
ncbi:type II toxin-antitoxin system VapC family toxin [Candidatus Woesearchaeota archaeon]|nr:type II toxin-antitoxin system VapC family toxin [Candidatus Woesearchaeota archaeon]